MKKIKGNGYEETTGKVTVDTCRYSSKSDIFKTEKCLDLLAEKELYPNDYANAFEKFNEEQLPSKEQFYGKLSEEDITNDDCNKAEQIRKHFKIKNMGAYHDHD